jgi:beta-phosphoglucomutase-like phosphatase (HAD superfamily)
MPGRAVRRHQELILAEAIVRARAAAPTGIAVFDLDSTLLDNRPRQARIAQDYGRTVGLPILLGARPEHWRSWDLEAGLAAVGIPGTLARRHRGPFRRFWAERFFTSAYCILDVPVPGAPAFVRAVAAAGARIAYVTGRPSRMEDGTLDVLRRHGFPLPDGVRTRLLMKPGDDLGDDAWKALARAEVDASGPVVLAFDNEPSHVNAYARAWPGALAVHVDTDHSPRPVEVLPSVPSIADFRIGAPLIDGAADATAAAP